MNKYTPSIGYIIFSLFMLLGIGMNALYTQALNTSTLNIDSLTNPYQLVTVGQNGQLTQVPNSYTTTSPTGQGYIVNLGAFSNYPNPNGMFNTYATSTNQPLLGASFMGTTNNYVQGVFVQNLATGTAASSDIVLADDLGTATSSSHYFDLGMANTGQVDGDHSLISPYSAYLYNQSGPLLLGTGIATSTIISAGMGSSSPSLTMDQYGHLITKGSSAGALSGCGTSPSVIGNDTNGVITLGAGLSVTACTKAFANPFPTGSNVTCSVSSNSLLSFASVSSVSTTGFNLGLSISLASGKVYYQCMASN